MYALLSYHFSVVADAGTHLKKNVSNNWEYVEAVLLTPKGRISRECPVCPQAICAYDCEVVIPGGSHMDTVYKLFTRSFLLLSSHHSSHARCQVMQKHTVSALSLLLTLEWLVSMFLSEVLNIHANELMISASYLYFGK